MKIIIFYEKPGCSTNKRQKQVLREAGYKIIERNLMHHGLSIDELRSFFQNKPMKEWFNTNAPQIKNGLVNPDSLGKKEALRLLFDTPLLIKRPLMLIEGQRLSGFDQNRIEELLKTSLAYKVSNSCSSHDEACHLDKRSVS